MFQYIFGRNDEKTRRMQKETVQLQRPRVLLHFRRKFSRRCAVHFKLLAFLIFFFRSYSRGIRSFKSGTISRRVAAIILICLEFVPLHFHCPPLPSSHRPREFFRARHPSSPSSAPFFNRYILPSLVLTLLPNARFPLDSISSRSSPYTDQQTHRLPVRKYQICVPFIIERK